MADRVLFISWERAARGREQLALDAFEEALGMYGRFQQDGRIEAFDVVLLAGSPAINGFIQVRGTAEQLAAVKESEEFLRSITGAELSVDGLTVLDGYTNEGVARMMSLYQEAVTRAPQLA